MNIYIDIETIPNQNPDSLQSCIDSVSAPGQYKKPESIEKWLIENREAAGHQNWLKTALNGDEGEIVSICYAAEDKEPRIFYRALESSEGAIIADFNAKLTNDLDLNGHTQKPFFIGHNVKKFDMPFIYKRMVINGIQPYFKLNPHGKHGFDLFDTMEAWAGFNNTISLSKLSKILGLQGKTEGMDGSMVWPEMQLGNQKKVASYCADDVELVRQIHNRLTFNTFPSVTQEAA